MGISVFAPGARGEGTATEKSEVVTVDSVDLNKYIGTWYEIAKIPNSFQRKCAMNTTATYAFGSDGYINVTNRCVESDGSADVAKGVARVVDEKTHSKLQVSFVSVFGIHLFWGDYWIIGLDKDYRYAVVGTPSRKYGWILSRTPKLSPDEKSQIDEILRRQGYDPASFVPTEQRQGS